VSDIWRQHIQQFITGKISTLSKWKTVENCWMPIPDYMRNSPTFPYWNFVCKFRVCCALCSQASSHRRITPFLRWLGHITCPQYAYNATGFPVRPVFQVGHQSELPQLCSFCAYAPNHMTMNTKSYTPTVSEISTSSVYQIRGLVNSFFFHPHIRNNIFMWVISL